MTEAPLTVVAPVFTVDDEVVRELARDCTRLEVCEGVEGLRTMQATSSPSAAGPWARRTSCCTSTGAPSTSATPSRWRSAPTTSGGSCSTGKVSGIELILGDRDAPVVIHAEDALMRLRMTRRMRTYSGVTDAEIAEELAVSMACRPTSTPTARYDVVQQANQSDLAFLRERARLIQAELWCTGRTLHFRSRATRQGTEVTLVRGSELLRARIVADLAHQRSEVVVTGWDAGLKELIDERAGPDVVEAEVSGGASAPGWSRPRWAPAPPCGSARRR